jgi:tetratricopeptide (TPR) repeat protein
MKIIYCSLLIAISLPLFAGTKTCVREYTYKAGEADSKITSRAIALDQVKRILLEEIGVYLQSSIETKKEERDTSYKELTTEQVQSITAGITETKIIEERWDGETYYIKASITVDPDEVNNNIARIANDQSKLKELEDVKRKADDAFAEIERLRKELAVTRSEADKLTKQKEYNTASNILSAADWFQKGYNALEVKEYDNAILYYQKAIELNPNFFAAYYSLGIAYKLKGNFDKAIQSYEKAIELNPNFSDAYYNLGLAYRSKGDLNKAIRSYEKAIELDPKDFGSYYNMGFAYNLNGDFDKAIQSYEKVIELNPNCFDACYNLGVVYESKGNLDKAIRFDEQAIELNPSSSEAYNNLGVAYKSKGNFDKAIQSYKKAIELNPTFFNAYSNLGVVYESKGNLDKAIQLFEKAIELNPNSSYSYGNLGWMYYLKNDIKKCIEYSSIAVSLDSMAFYAKYNIALAKLRSGRFDEARKSYEDLRIPMRSIPEADPEGAINDLKDLIAQGIHSRDAAFILENVFNVKARKK